jgi:hypothetical protein
MRRGRAPAWPFLSQSFVCYSLAMTGRVEGWRVDRQDEEIKLLRERIYEAEGKIRELERRPLEWLLKAEMAFLWLLIAAMWVFAIVEIASKN